MNLMEEVHKAILEDGVSDDRQAARLDRGRSPAWPVSGILLPERRPLLFRGRGLHTATRVTDEEQSQCERPLGGADASAGSLSFLPS